MKTKLLICMLVAIVLGACGDGMLGYEPKLKTIESNSRSVGGVSISDYAVSSDMVCRYIGFDRSDKKF